MCRSATTCTVASTELRRRSASTSRARRPAPAPEGRCHDGRQATAETVQNEGGSTVGNRGAALHARRTGSARQSRAEGAAAIGARQLGAAGPPARSGRPARGAGGDAPAGARADPTRAHACVALHVLPRGGLHYGGGPRRRSPDRIVCSALRRRASVQLRGFRRARPEARLQHQRLRRDTARPIRVGRETTRGELCRRRTRSRLR